MKQRKVKLTKEDKFWIIGCLILMAALMAIPKVWGATYTHAFTWRDPDGIYDSLLYRIKVGNTVRDSSRVALGDSVNTSVTLDQDSTYVEEVFVWYTGATMWSSPSSTILPRWTGGSATMDYNGTGTYSCLFWAVDTSGTDDSVSNVRITITTLAGTEANWPLETNSIGAQSFDLDTGSYIVTAYLPWYAFPTDTITVAAMDTFIISGYNRANPSAPAATNLCAVYGYVYEMPAGGGYSGAQYARVIFSLPQNVVNTCDSAISLQRVQTVETDADGYFQINLLKSNCVQVNGNNQAYRVWVEGADGVRSREHKLTIPSDSSTYKLVF